MNFLKILLIALLALLLFSFVIGTLVRWQLEKRTTYIGMTDKKNNATLDLTFSINRIGMSKIRSV